MCIRDSYKRCRYFFELQAGAERVFYFEDGFHSPEDVKNGQLGQCFTFPWMNSVDINVTPKWVRETVWYQIFPERFCNGNKENDPDWVKPWGYHTVSNLDFYGGDLDGIQMCIRDRLYLPPSVGRKQCRSAKAYKRSAGDAEKTGGFWDRKDSDPGRGSKHGRRRKLLSDAGSKGRMVFSG